MHDSTCTDVNGRFQFARYNSSVYYNTLAELRSRAVTRNLLGQIDAAKMERYEDHFFACGVCTREIEVGSDPIMSVRAVVLACAAFADGGLGRPRRCRLPIRTYESRNE